MKKQPNGTGAENIQGRSGERETELSSHAPGSQDSGSPRRVQTAEDIRECSQVPERTGPLTSTECWLIANALRVASGQYWRDAESLQKSGDERTSHAMAEQAKSAEAWAERFETATRVEVRV